VKSLLFPGGLLVSAILLAMLSRPDSPGARLGNEAGSYAAFLSCGDADSALAMMSAEAASGLSPIFLSRLQGLPVPVRFVFDGTDSRGIRMAGSAGDYGTRIIWFSDWSEPFVTHDSALDNLLGSAVILCRQNAAENPQSNCPVSGAPYLYDQTEGRTVCPEGHLGDGIVVSSIACPLRRDSVALELDRYIEAGYGTPASLEEMFTVSGGEFGRRGGYRCPDNGYKYYELRDGTVYCPFHDESSPAAAVE